MVEVISIAQKYEPILSFLYPDYAIVENVALTRKFITHREVKSKHERELIEVSYDNCVMISNQIFDVYWDVEVIKQKVVEFARKNFKSRRRSYETSEDTLVQDSLNFMFGLISEEQEASITELFDVFGSANFTKVFIQKSQQIPLPVLVTSMNTFISRVLSADSSVYYRKKAMIFGEKIRNNMLKSIDSLALRDNDVYGLSYAMFYNDLVK